MTEMKIIARIRTELPEKFGVPRQSGLVPQLRGRVIFEPEYRNPDAVRGLEDFSHIWLIWQFSRAVREGWSPTVRLDRVELDPALGPVLHVSGADLMDGTPIFDIKPYLPYTDSHPQAAGGFTDGLAHEPLTVECSPALLEHIPADSREGLLGVLAGDPRPRYQEDPQRVYGLSFAGRNVKFTVDGDRLTVIAVE